MRWPSAKFWGYSGIILAVCLILNWKWSQGRLESDRQKLMTKQRAAAVELGPKWSGLRGRVERWTLELARDAGQEVVDQEALRSWDFRQMAGLYLRLRVDEAKSEDAIRKGAVGSLRDAFTSCLIRVPNASPLAGAECKRTRDCPQGEHCNENDRCAKPAQPFNLRVAYRTMHVLSEEWVRDVQEASNELRLRVLDGSFDDIMQDDIRVAADLLTRAQYYLVVLDEPAQGAAPAAQEGESETEALLAAPHTARVGLWRLSDDKLVLRVRREANGQLVGGMPTVEPGALEARKRQANSCALALAVREAMGDTSAASTPPQ
ncbi:MAG: hypothetical protein IT372_28535 [Polyangiaceae bacterium]|nr:hypothetical protein [Polyangiaceae bacterium]